MERPIFFLLSLVALRIDVLTVPQVLESPSRLQTRPTDLLTDCWSDFSHGRGIDHP